MHIPPPPNSRDLLPPLLSCLPTALVSSQPPPALLPLLSPILRQRLTYLSAGASSGEHKWLPLLSWDSSEATNLGAVVGRMVLEPHPVSGEIELEDVRPAKYKRLDEETLHAQFEVDEFDLAPIYVWCENDEHGQTGPGWKLTDLKALEDVKDRDQWFDSPSEAADALLRGSDSINTHTSNATLQPNRVQSRGVAEDEEDDGDYWASYDRTPNRTPATKTTPAPAAGRKSSLRDRSQSELEYFARYGAEVQPAMDPHDPDEEHPEIGTGGSTLTGDALVRELARQAQQGRSMASQQQKQPTPPTIVQPAAQSNGVSPPAMFPSDPVTPETHNERSQHGLSMPRPISPASSHSSIERLEQEAETMSSYTSPTSRFDDRAQIGIKQHISTDVKSLFRLARSVGMERDEFDRIVRTELDVLSMMED